MSLYSLASCQYPNKRHGIIQTSVPNKRHVIIQTSVPNKRRSYPNKRRVIIRTSDDIIQTSVMTLSKQDKRHVIIQTRQAARHYSNKRPNPSIDTPHRTGTLGMKMYTHINYSQSVHQWIVVVQLQV